MTCFNLIKHNISSKPFLLWFYINLILILYIILSTRQFPVKATKLLHALHEIIGLYIFFFKTEILNLKYFVL